MQNNHSTGGPKCIQSKTPFQKTEKTAELGDDDSYDIMVIDAVVPMECITSCAVFSASA